MGRTLCVFSDGTGQRGVKVEAGSTNIFKMYEWARTDPDQICFYDPGVGTEPTKQLDWSTWTRNQIAKATGTGITRNIHDCYDFIVKNWTDQSRLAVFGFSRGAYTVRSLAAAVSLCGIPDNIQKGLDITTDNSAARKLRHTILDEAIAIYQSFPGKEGKDKRQDQADDFKIRYRCRPAPVHLVAVFDTVAALGLPGIINVVNPFRFKFHDHELGQTVPFGFQALSIDENREIFGPVIWQEAKKPASQTIDQVWFPGVHSDVGGGYKDSALSDVALQWMLDKCSAPAVGIRFALNGYRSNASVLGKKHDERTGWGRLWWPGTRAISCADRDRDRLCDKIEGRYDHWADYRPASLAKHPRVQHYYPSAP